MLSDSRGPADLAATAARAAGRGARTTEFEVVHRATDSEDALPLSMTELAQSDENAHSKVKAQETLGFDIPGASFEVRTWSSMTELPTPAGIAIRNAPGGAAGTRERVRVVTGVGALNPSHHAAPHIVELLVTLRHGRWQMDQRDSLMMSEALEMMSGAAADVGMAPIVLLQSPVATFRNARHKFRYDGSGEQPRQSRGLAVRMATAIDDAHPASRIGLLRHVTSKAADMGLGVQIADDRLGRARGDWWEIVAADPTTYERHKSAYLTLAAAAPVRRVQLLTFVGPARPSSTLAIVRELRSHHVGIVAISVSALQELAFINLVVSVPEERLDLVPADQPESLTNAVDYFASLAGLSDGPQKPPRGGSDLRRLLARLNDARDYHVIPTGPVAFRDSEGLHRPLWVSWEIPAGLHDVQMSIPEVIRGVLIGSPHCTSVSLDYFRSRILPSGQIRGRAKVAVTLAKGRDGKLAEVLSELCEHAEAEGRRALTTDEPDVVANLRLRLAWRERWLDQWRLVL